MTARLDRHEIKFVITHEQRAAIETELLPQLRPDTNAVDGAFYPVVSLYYDTPDRRCYWERAHGHPMRRKLRVRVYGTGEAGKPPTVFVEIKQKNGERSVKRRLNVTLDDALAIAAGEAPSQPPAFADGKLIAEIHRMVNVEGFRPCVIVRYERHAYAARDAGSDLRVTFDTRLAYRFHNLEPAPDDRRFEHYALDDDRSVMEVKAIESVPYRVTRLLGALGCSLRSHSKYSEVLERGDATLLAMLGRVK